MAEAEVEGQRALSTIIIVKRFHLWKRKKTSLTPVCFPALPGDTTN